MSLDAYACSMLVQAKASRSLINNPRPEFPKALVDAWSHGAVTSRSQPDVYVSRAGELITSMRVDRCGAHDYVRVWNRGGLAGELTMLAGDGHALAAYLGLTSASVRYTTREEDE